MKWILLVLILVSGCTAEIYDDVVNGSYIDPINESVSGVGEPIIDEPDPLEVILSSEVLESELVINTTIGCYVSGGKEPYNYGWNIGDCNEECDVFIDEIGEHPVWCEVVDSLGNVDKDSLVLSVIKEQRKLDNIVFFGDSLTYGEGLDEPAETRWASRFSGEISGEVHNFAVSGANTLGVLDQIEQFDSEGDNLIFVWIGANDIVNLITPEQFKENYQKIVDELIDKGELIIMNIPDASKLSVALDVEEGVNEYAAQFGIKIDVKGIAKDTISIYNDIIYEIVFDNNLSMIDIYSYMETFGDDLITSDRFHPNSEGHKLIASKVKEELDKFYPKVDFI